MAPGCQQLTERVKIDRVSMSGDFMGLLGITQQLGVGVGAAAGSVGPTPAFRARTRARITLASCDEAMQAHLS